MNSDKSTQFAALQTRLRDESVLLLDATLEHIFISPGHDYWGNRGTESPIHGISDLPQVRCVEGRGLEGDRYFNGRPWRLGQVTFFQAEVADAIRNQFGLPNLDASAFRRNLVVRGARLHELIGKQFVFQGLMFEGTQECKPCVWMDRAVAIGAQTFMRDAFRGGLRARVLTTGCLRAAGR